MVIKDLLNKVSKPGDAKDPKVQALRDKLQKLQKKGGAKPAKKAPGAAPKKAAPAGAKPAAARPDDQAIQALAKGSDLQKRQFAQYEHPELKLKEERTNKLMAKQIGEMIQLTQDMNKRLLDLEKERQKAKQEVERVEKQNKDIQEKMNIIDQRLEKFMGLYEVITNQYNPFADGPSMGEDTPNMPGPTEGQNLNVSDSLTGEQQEVPLEQGNMSSENKKKMDQLLAELEQQEQEKKQAPEEEVQQITDKEEETKQTVVSELHTMFQGFEERLTKHVDTAVQDKLHELLEGLETTVTEEVDHAVKEEVKELKDNEQVIADALAEIQNLSEKATDQEQYTQEAAAVVQEIQSVDDQIKAIPPSLYFRLHDGRILKSKKDLVEALQSLPEPVFTMHVQGDRNDFADWLEMALQDSVGKEIRGKQRQEMIQILS